MSKVGSQSCGRCHLSSDHGTSFSAPDRSVLIHRQDRSKFQMKSSQVRAAMKAGTWSSLYHTDGWRIVDNEDFSQHIFRKWGGVLRSGENLDDVRTRVGGGIHHSSTPGNVRHINSAPVVERPTTRSHPDQAYHMKSVTTGTGCVLM